MVAAIQSDYSLNFLTGDPVPFASSLPGNAAGAPPLHESLLVAVDEIARRGFHGELPDLGPVRRGRASVVRDEIAIDWNISRDNVDKRIERWGRLAEMLVRVLLDLEGLTLLHITEALRGWRGQPARPSAQKTPQSANHVHKYEFNLDSFLLAPTIYWPMLPDSPTKITT